MTLPREFVVLGVIVELHAPSPLSLHPRWHSPQPRPRAGGRAAGFASGTTSS